MAKPNANFRPDPDRSIGVFGDLTDELVSGLIPRILDLRRNNDAPITVLINSNGGSFRCLDFLRGLLTTRDPYERRPRVICVAVGNAKSAAANLLTLGDYAASYPRASIHFHGVRFPEAEDVTMEAASLMAAQLTRTNQAMAAELARAGMKRLALLYAYLKFKTTFDSVRQKLGSSGISDIECFARLLQDELSSVGDRIVDRALKRWEDLKVLSHHVFRRALGDRKSPKEFEAEVLRRIITFEVRRNKNNPDWELDAAGVSQIASDYLLMRDYNLGPHRRLVKTIMDRWGSAFFEEAELHKLKSELSDDKAREGAVTRTQEVIRPFCYFAASIWQGLQEEENPLSPKDAYWLGAVDEVYDLNLPCLRDIAEAKDLEQPSLPLGTPTI